MDILKKGTVVSIKHTTMTGEIKEAQIISEQLQYRVAYLNNEGKAQERWFAEGDLVVVE